MRSVLRLGPRRAPFTAERIGAGPIITPGMPGLEGERGASINGPSVVRVPDWAPNALGRYYLYFAHHHGEEIRLAHADKLDGPWALATQGALRLADTAAHGHVASPDVHVDDEARRFRMYFHGYVSPAADRQGSFLATSSDGLHYVAAPQVVQQPVVHRRGCDEIGEPRRDRHVAMVPDRSDTAVHHRRASGGRGDGERGLNAGWTTGTMHAARVATVGGHRRHGRVGPHRDG